jgi:hypothetical protein
MARVFSPCRACSVVDMMNPTYSGVVMVVSKEKNVTMMFSKVSTRRCQKMNNIMWSKATKTLDLAYSIAYTISRGIKRLGAHSTYVCYGYRKDPLRMTLDR